MNTVVSITRLSVIREGPSEVICPRRLFVPDRNIVLSMLPTSLLPALWWVAASTVAATQALAAESTADGVSLSKGAVETVVTPAPHDPVSPEA